MQFIFYFYESFSACDHFLSGFLDSKIKISSEVPWIIAFETVPSGRTPDGWASARSRRSSAPPIRPRTPSGAGRQGNDEGTGMGPRDLGARGIGDSMLFFLTTGCKCRPPPPTASEENKGMSGKTAKQPALPSPHPPSSPKAKWSVRSSKSENCAKKTRCHAILCDIGRRIGRRRRSFAKLCNIRRRYAKLSDYATLSYIKR